MKICRQGFHPVLFLQFIRRSHATPKFHPYFRHSLLKRIHQRKSLLPNLSTCANTNTNTNTCTVTDSVRFGHQRDR